MSTCGGVSPHPPQRLLNSSYISTNLREKNKKKSAIHFDRAVICFVGFLFTPTKGPVKFWTRVLPHEKLPKRGSPWKGSTWKCLFIFDMSRGWVRVSTMKPYPIYWLPFLAFYDQLCVFSRRVLEGNPILVYHSQLPFSRILNPFRGSKVLFLIALKSSFSQHPLAVLNNGGRIFSPRGFSMKPPKKGEISPGPITTNYTIGGLAKVIILHPWLCSPS